MGLQDQDGRRTSSWKVFPSTRTRASYFPSTQHIELYEVTLPELKEALLNMRGNPQLAIVVLPLLFHELRHWFDHVATLWGMRRLVSLFNAMNARTLDQEVEFWRIVEYQQLLDRDHLSDFYTTTGRNQPPPGYPNRWMYSLTCGRRYDRFGRLDPERPIIFTRYEWADGSPACRVPFSVASLLETGSMAFETEFEAASLEGFPPGERQIERNRIIKERVAELYDVDLGVYTTAVHLIANRMDLYAADEAFPIAGALASLCLNLPDGLFDRLRIPREFAPWGDYNRAAILQRDRGYLFMLLCSHARKDLVDDATRWVENAARRAGLPPLFEIREQTSVAMNATLGTAIGGPYRSHLEQVAQVGMRMHRELGIVFTLKDTLKAIERLTLPPIVCVDSKIHALDAALIPSFEEWCSETSRLHEMMSEFVAACGY
jgi:hypothetical protein